MLEANSMGDVHRHVGPGQRGSRTSPKPLSLAKNLRRDSPAVSVVESTDPGLSVYGRRASETPFH